MSKKSPRILNGYKKIPKNQFKKFNCDVCDYHTSNKKDFMKHCSTKKHGTKWIQANFGKNKFFSCNDCDYISCSKEDLGNHFLAFSHTNLSLEEGTNFSALDNTQEKFICNYCNY